MPMCLAQPGLEKQAQKLGQWPARPDVDPRFRLSARRKERGLQMITEKTEKLKPDGWRDLSNIIWQDGGELGHSFVFLPCPALCLVSVYLDPYPRGKATTLALHEHGSGTKGIWGLSCLLFFFTQLNRFFIGEQWLQWCSAHFYFPEHLTVPCI